MCCIVGTPFFIIKKKHCNTFEIFQRLTARACNLMYICMYIRQLFGVEAHSTMTMDECARARPPRLT